MARAKTPRSIPVNQLRLIGGQWRGRRLSFPDSEGLRPTPDRIRETLFNWLQFEVPGARVADLFSGSGALGLEALSRDAATVTLIDRSSPVVRQLETNLTLLGSDRGEVIQANVLEWLNQPAMQTFDLVFLDPPFRQGLLTEACERLDHNGWLSDEAWIYIEAERELKELPVPNHWRLHRQKQAGQVSCYLFQREGSGTAG